MQSQWLCRHVRDKLANRQKITVTTDYSCLDKCEQQDMATLRRWHDEGLIELQGTEAMIEEFERASPSVKAKLEQQYLGLEKLIPEFGTVLGSWRLGYSRLGEVGTLRDGKDALDYYSEFQELMFANFGHVSSEQRVRNFRDVMHISIHYLFARDIFLTRNVRHFKADKLRRKFSDLVILTPKQCVDVLENATISRG